MSDPMPLDTARDLVRRWSDTLRYAERTGEYEGDLAAERAGVLDLLDELEGRRKAAGYPGAVAHTREALLAEIARQLGERSTWTGAELTEYARTGTRPARPTDP